MQLIPPPTTKHQWVYDDPSGIAEPAAYLRAWPRRAPKRAPRVIRERVRIAHREA